MVFAGSLTEKPLAIAFPTLLTPSKVQKVLFPSCFNPLFLRPPNPAASFSSRLNASESLPDPDLQSVVTSSAPASLQACADSRERFRRVIEMERKEVNWQPGILLWVLILCGPTASYKDPRANISHGSCDTNLSIYSWKKHIPKYGGGGGESTSSDPSYEFLA